MKIAIVGSGDISYFMLRNNYLSVIGVSGLAAASSLTEKGHVVTVFEAQNHVSSSAFLFFIIQMYDNCCIMMLCKIGGHAMTQTVDGVRVDIGQ